MASCHPSPSPRRPAGEKPGPAPAVLSPKPDRGLTASQAAERAAAGLTNQAPRSNSKTEGQILRENIQNKGHNRTRFVVIEKEMRIPEDAQKISLCFSLPHTTGSLYSVLARFAMNGLNLTKIESRPTARDTAGGTFEYDFYLDFTGRVADPRTLDLICELSEELPHFSFLGNYREDVFSG